jgi:methyltransferase (TIGR00027 family)
MRPHTASHTAQLVARSIVLASKDEPLCRLLAPRSAETLAKIPEVKWHFMRRLMLALERLALPGVIAHYLARKLCIEAELRSALSAGAGRVVVFGAGFDTLVWRLHHEFPEVRWVEIDHHATQEVKARALGAAANLTYVSLDLMATRPICQLLDAPGAPVVPTVVVVEGVTMYLTAEKVAALLTDCAQLAGARGRVILTYMEMDGAGSIDFRAQNRAVRWWLRLCAEPFIWGISRASVKPFLASCGLGEVTLIDHGILRATTLTPRGLPAIPLAEGECICTCFPL